MSGCSADDFEKDGGMQAWKVLADARRDEYSIAYRKSFQLRTSNKLNNGIAFVLSSTSNPSATVAF